MRSLIDPCFYKTYRVGFLPIPSVDLFHATLLDFNCLPDIKVINTSIREDFIRPRILQEHDESAIIIMDKPNVHSLYSLMITQSGRTAKKSFTELTWFEKKKTFEVASKFFQFWRRSPELYNHYLPRFSYNHDPFTSDRPGLQSIERFHAHLYLTDLVELEKNLKTAVTLDEILPRHNYKDYFDPSAIFFENLLIDAHRAILKVPDDLKLIHMPMKDKIEAGLGLGLNWSYDGDINYFSTDRFLNYLDTIHQFLENYFKIPLFLENNHGIFFDKEDMKQKIEDDRILSNQTKEYLRRMVSHLKPLEPKIYNYLKTHSHWAKNVISYRKLSYSFSIDFNSTRNSFLISMIPKLFSEIGGAGFFSYKQANCMIIQRGIGKKFTEIENDLRRNFQLDFLDYCEEHSQS